MKARLDLTVLKNGFNYFFQTSIGILQQCSGLLPIPWIHVQIFMMLYQKGQKESLYYSPHSFNSDTDLLQLSNTAVMFCAVI